MGKYDDVDLIEQLMGKTQDEIEKMDPVNIMLIGKTGVGKSTLINSLFREQLATTGIGKPVTKHLRRITKEGVPLVLYDTRGLELNPDTQAEIQNEILDTIKKSYQVDHRDNIHIIYYCINGSAGRIEDPEIEMINNLGKALPVIVVITQSIGNNSKDLKKYIEKIGLNVKGVINVVSAAFQLSNDLILPAFGLRKLMELTFDNIPKSVYKSFNNAQRVDIPRKTQAARRWAKRYIATTFGVGFVPIPFSDAAVLVPMQIGMLAHITAIFGVSMDHQKIAGIVAGVGGTGGATFLGRYIVSNILKFIPGVGTIAGGLISGATASLLTTALAMSYIEVLAIIAKREVEGKETDLSEIQEMMKKFYEDYLKRKKQS